MRQEKPVLLSLTDVRRIATEVARQQHPALEVVGAIAASSYAEVVLSVRDDPAECRMIVGVSRDASEPECRDVMTARLQQHLADHLSPTVR
jgi:hypothetical protein